MKIQVKLFAYLKESLGESVELEIPAHTPAEQLPALLSKAFPQIAQYTEVCRVAVNNTYAAAGVSIEEGDQVAVFPPVSGG